MNKKAMTDFELDVLTILLTIVAVVIVWASVKSSLDKSNLDESPQRICEIKGLIYNNNFCYKIESDIIIQKYEIKKINRGYYLHQK